MTICYSTFDSNVNWSAADFLSRLCVVAVCSALLGSECALYADQADAVLPDFAQVIEVETARRFAVIESGKTRILLLPFVRFQGSRR
jgi:hypothetical protein